MSTCATSAPIDLATSNTNSLQQIEETLVATYPVTVNSPRHRRRPAAPRPRAGRSLAAELAGADFGLAVADDPLAVLHGLGVARSRRRRAPRSRSP